jgi:hypothetical protein
MNRRYFLNRSAAAAGCLAFSRHVTAASAAATGTPSYKPIWLDGIATPLQRKNRNGKVVSSPPNRPENAPEFRCQALYDRIHSLQPQVLVSYKQGLLGTEDFFAPEHKSIAN